MKHKRLQKILATITATTLIAMVLGLSVSFVYADPVPTGFTAIDTATPASSGSFNFDTDIQPDTSGGNVTGAVSNQLITNPLKNASTIDGLLKLILNSVVLPVGGVIAVIFIIYSGFLFVTAQGNGDRLTKARNAFFQAVVGTAILLGSVAIMDLIINTLKTITNAAK